MSKLFPMFKRKGKGKEEEIEEEPRKKHGKARKHSKEDHRSPSPGSAPTSSKPQKKRKAKELKRKAPIPGGKENNSKPGGSEGQLHGEFHVDDSGIVQPGPPLQLLVDDIPASKDDLFTTSNDDTLELENKLEDSHIRNYHSDTEGKENLEVGSDGDDVSHESYAAEVNVVQEPSDGHINHCEEEVSSEKQGDFEEHVLNGYEMKVENIIGYKPATSVDTKINQEARSDEAVRHPSSDFPADDDIGNVCDIYRIPPPKIRASTEEETDTAVVKVTDDAVATVETDSKTEDNQEAKKELDECLRRNTQEQKNVSSEDIDEIIMNGKGTMSEEGVTERGVESNEITMVEQDERLHGITATQLEAITVRSDSPIDDSSPRNSQDSDDDFDSAQEEWDEDYDADISAESKMLIEERSSTAETLKLIAEEGTDDSGFSKHFKESQDFGKSPIEAANDVLISRKCEESEVPVFLREPSSSSSLYQDAPFSFEDSEITDVSSIVDASNEFIRDPNGEDRKYRSSSPKLTRKISNISVASSDIFNEELDELLDEELDRLSEEEVKDIGVSSVEEIDARPVEDITVIDTVDEVIQEKELRLEATEAEETSGQEKMTVVPPEINIEISDQIEDSEEAHENGIHNLPNQMTGVAVSHTLEESDTFTTESEEARSSEEKMGSEEKGKLSSLSAPEEGLDQAKDSGYYSLPVSPKPGEAVRGSEAPEMSKQVADDSFGDSEEEEGMMTPPSEVPPPSDETKKFTETNAKNNESLLDSSVTNESLLYQSCSESQGVEERENIDKQKEIVQLAEENGKEISTEPQEDGKPKSPKLYIPKDTLAELKEGATSPRGGSTPTRHSRHKSPLLECENKQQSEEGLQSPDPVGDKFLEQAVFVSHEEAEARLAQRRAARAEARELRLRELEKQQQDQENDEEKQFTTPSYAEPSPRSAGTGRTSSRTVGLNSTGQYSRRSSEDSTTDESLPANVREMRAELKELDEKFRKAMITNAQLDNEKATLTFEVELMKDRYTELEETHTQLTKEHRKKCTEYEQLRKVSTKLQEEVKILRGLLQERDQLIQEYGLVVVGEEENGEEGESEKEEDDMDDLSPRKIAVKKALISQEASELLAKGAAKGSLDIRLRKFGEEKNDLEDQVRRLKLELEEERNKNRRRENGLDYEKQKEQNKTVNEYKFRVQKAEAEVSTLQANVARLDALSTRYRTQSEELEKSEEELKVERRKLQRELRDAQSRLEELETTNNHLIKRFDKLKNARSTLLKDLSQDPA